MNRVPIPGSERDVLAGAERTGDIDPGIRTQVTITLRRRAQPQPGEQVSREAFAERYGADPADVERVEAFAREHGLEVAEASPERRTVVLAGTLAQLQDAFGASLALYRHDGGTYRGRTGALTVPQEVAPAIESVLGLDDRPAARAHFRRVEAAAATAGFAPKDLASLYGFPEGDGSGRTVALIELGGGFTTADLTTYWREQGISPAPQVTAVSVDGAQSTPDGPDGADGEVMLDIEVVGSIAPAAHIAVYFAPNTTAGFLDAITTAIHDTARRPSVISISWGQAEDNWTAQARSSYDAAFQDAATVGVTICVAAGDDGSADNVGDGQAHVDFPSSSPNVVACGGTKLTASGTTIASEIVWNEPDHGATGGGVSRFFALPDYQSGAHVPDQSDTGKPGRGVPDVAGNADPLTGYRIRVDGTETTIGGTSAVAPLWAGLLARIGGDPGFVNAKLYAAGVLRDITSGSNGAYDAASGWDACTGLGSPDGAKVAAALK
jgi:kumamolisin